MYVPDLAMAAPIVARVGFNHVIRAPANFFLRKEKTAKVAGESRDSGFDDGSHRPKVVAVLGFDNQIPKEKRVQVSCARFGVDDDQSGRAMMLFPPSSEPRHGQMDLASSGFEKALIAINQECLADGQLVIQVGAGVPFMGMAGDATSRECTC